MLAQLRRGRAIELSTNERNICIEDDFKGSLAELFRRGLVSTKMVMLDGKETLGVYITQAGKIYLDTHHEDAKKLRSEFNIF